ncbi:MAG: hypothetical protein WCF17_18410 [Terracidiphilus sp.]
MSPANVLSEWDTALLMAPFVAMLAAWMFGLDELVFKPRAKRRARFSLTEANGRVAFTDPDGRPWKIAAGAGRRTAWGRRRWKNL